MNVDINKLVRQNILNLAPYSSARDEFSGTEGVFLDANENPNGSYNRYPDPHQVELKNVLGKVKSVSPDNIFLGNGSDEVTGSSSTTRSASQYGRSSSEQRMGTLYRSNRTPSYSVNY